MCQAGRHYYPDDPEVLFQESLTRRDLKDLAGAVACLEQVLAGKADQHFASVDMGLRGYRTAHDLALLYKELGKLPEAEANWHAAVTERPDLGGGSPGGALSRPEALGPFRENARGPAEATAGLLGATILRARAWLTQKEFGPARDLLTREINAHPKAVELRVLLATSCSQGPGLASGGSVAASDPGTCSRARRGQA